ncbi:hypothetical protein [Nocardioides deserti]|uniref:Uncharacterized protein n=1 Tax=Nocardioides deserti TaxID=1588644 RepID=A0ABR6U996_9ACTN|nr:hypothetical protein [Nocardioides deserti]MBC2961017.1 hypothetical protein [Nocardioides deserti]GGO76120.1 hypothetical protein GCM10012276_28120 [Nocardioides deserti]
MTPEDVRRLAATAHERWTELELVHRSDYLDVHATLRHGELDAVVLDDGRRIREHEAPSSSWDVRPLEPYATNYLWSAMLDPHELTAGVEIGDVRRSDLFGRPVVVFTARAVDGYDPVCSCCPLVFSEVSERLEHGDDWTPPPLGVLPTHVELALDLEVGIVVSKHERGGHHRRGWFTNELLRAV